MTWDKQGNLFCNWCGNIVIPARDITKHDKEFNTGWTKCVDCIGKTTPYPKEGELKDLPEDFNPKVFERA